MNKGDAGYTIYSASNDIYTEGISSPSFPGFGKDQSAAKALLECSTDTITGGKHKYY